MNSLLYIVLLLLSCQLFSQRLVIPEDLEIPLQEPVKSEILIDFTSLLGQIDQGSVDEQLIHNENAALTISILNQIESYELQDSLKYYYQKQLMALYPLSKEQYFLTFAYLDKRDTAKSAIKSIINLIAVKSAGSVKFSLPLEYLTQNWKSKTVGNIQYFYRDTLNNARAEAFNLKNNMIAKKLGLPAESFKYYMCKNYKDILPLLGYQYHLASSGQLRDGYGVDSGFIFSVCNNEDFSHDIFHYYSGKINKREDRNWITEEGIAYSWGNAYYTDPDGEMISNQQLVKELKAYLAKHSQVKLLDLFVDRPKIFNHLAPEVSVRSVISGVLCDAVERKRGMEGLLKLINCGRRPNLLDTYFQALNELIGIHRGNFDPEVKKLLAF